MASPPRARYAWRVVRCRSHATLVALAALAATPPAAADGPPAAAAADDDARRFALGADALATLPVGTMADATGPLVGAAVRLGYWLSPRLELALRAGYQVGLKTDVAPVVDGVVDRYGIDNLRASGGARYFFLQPYAGLYASLEMGVSALTPVRSRGDETRRGDAERRLGVGVGVGYVLGRTLPIHAGAQLDYLNLLGVPAEGENVLLGVTFLLGYEARL